MIYMDKTSWFRVGSFFPETPMPKVFNASKVGLFVVFGLKITTSSIHIHECVSSNLVSTSLCGPPKETQKYQKDSLKILQKPICKRIVELFFEYHFNKIHKIHYPDVYECFPKINKTSHFPHNSKPRIWNGRCVAMAKENRGASRGSKSPRICIGRMW